jgi:hypothetical protein
LTITADLEEVAAGHRPLECASLPFVIVEGEIQDLATTEVSILSMTCVFARPFVRGDSDVRYRCWRR